VLPIRDAFAELLTVAFPSRLEALRAAEDMPWQPDSHENYCYRCGGSVGPGEATLDGCHDCRGTRPPWKRVVRLGAYKPPLSTRIVAMKFGRSWPWATKFGHQLGDVIGKPHATQPTIVCPVPLHWRRRLARGFDQTRLIAEALAARLNLPCMQLLRRTRHTQPMTLQPVSKRRAAVRGAFACQPLDLTGHDVWLVDDVLTTGATLRACCRQLKACGAERINVAVVAKSSPGGGDFTTG